MPTLRRKRTVNKIEKQKPSSYFNTKAKKWTSNESNCSVQYLKFQ